MVAFIKDLKHILLGCFLILNTLNFDFLYFNQVFLSAMIVLLLLFLMLQNGITTLNLLFFRVLYLSILFYFILIFFNFETFHLVSLLSLSLYLIYICARATIKLYILIFVFTFYVILEKTFYFDSLATVSLLSLVWFGRTKTKKFNFKQLKFEQRPLKVALSITNLEKGGAENQIVTLAKALSDLGVKVKVFTSSGGDNLTRLIKFQIPYCITGYLEPIRGFKSLSLNEQLLRSLRIFFRLIVHFYRFLKFKPDVSLSYLTAASLPTILLAKITGTSIVLSSRRSMNFYLGKSKMIDFFEKQIESLSDGLTVNSEIVLQETVKLNRSKINRTWLIKNGLSPEIMDLAAKFDREYSTDLKKKSLQISCVANFMPYKGHIYLIDAFRKLSAQYNNVVLNLVGDGPLRQDIEKLSNGLKVRFYGSLDSVDQILKKSDIFVLPSLTEGMSNALIEAMSFGLPCIATDVGGNKETLLGAGVLVSPKSSEEIYKALTGFIETPYLMSKLGKRAKSIAFTNYSDTQLALKHLQLFYLIRNKKCVE